MTINNLAATAEAGYEYCSVDERQLQWRLHSAGMGQVLSQAGVWIHADAIPDLRQVRAEADVEAAVIYESHMSQLRDGVIEGVPLDSDSLSAATRALGAERQFGSGSAEHLEARLGVQVNFQRYLAETWSKLGPEYFAPLRQTYDAAADDYLSYSFPITPMLHRGITPLAEAGEVPRRFMENRENATNNRLGKLVMKASGVLLDDQIPDIALPKELRSGSVSSQTISECPDHIIDRYQQDVQRGLKRGYSGYAPQIKKLMLRDTAFDPLTGDRFVEQLSVSGEFIDHQVILAYYELKGVIGEGQAPDKTEVLGLQVLTDTADGVLGMARQLDVIAGEMHGKNLFLGREVPTDHPKAYGDFPAEAAAREAKQAVDAEALTQYALSLAAAGVDHAIGNKLIDEMVEEQMFQHAKADDTFAEIALDKETAAELRLLRAAQSRGDHDEVYRLEQRARNMAPPPEGCSGGSCAVIEVDERSAEGRGLSKLLRARPGDKLAKDESRHRRCKCGGQIVYAYTENRVNKACTACKSFESKVSVVSANS